MYQINSTNKNDKTSGSICFSILLFSSLRLIKKTNQNQNIAHASEKL